MKINSYLALVIFCFALVLSCDREAHQEAIQPQEDSPSLEKKKDPKKPLPMRAVFYTDLDIPAILAGVKDCSGSADFPTPNVQTGEGNAIHMGKIKVSLKFCGVQITDPTPEEAAAGLVFRYGELEGHFEAANGDRINIELVGTGEIYFTDEPGYDLEFSDEFIINGGTGRFAEASGMMRNQSFVNLTTQRTDHVWTGNIRRK